MGAQACSSGNDLSYEPAVEQHLDQGRLAERRASDIDSLISIMGDYYRRDFVGDGGVVRGAIHPEAVNDFASSPDVFSQQPIETNLDSQSGEQPHDFAHRGVVRKMDLISVPTKRPTSSTT